MGAPAGTTAHRTLPPPHHSCNSISRHLLAAQVTLRDRPPANTKGWGSTIQEEWGRVMQILNSDRLTRWRTDRVSDRMGSALLKDR